MLQTEFAALLERGINSSLRDCYEWLAENYDDSDDVFIFGFSRGAYVARSVAGFVERCVWVPETVSP
jgi:uncharacterized protein (DUF2235 family)